MKIAVIGGGAAGMTAALAAGAKLKGMKLNERFAREGEPFSHIKSDEDHEVVLFEKNEQLGVKVLLSGGGRSNLTTGIENVKQILSSYPRGARFLRTAMCFFGPAQVMEFFNGGGVKLKIEADNRVFPADDDGKSVVDYLEKSLHRVGVKIHFNEQVLLVEKDESGRFSIKTRNAKEYKADKVIITTGGCAYKQTGSTGDGYSFAEKLGHRITPLAPSLGAFVLSHVNERLSANDGFSAGVSFKKVALTLEFFKGGGRRYERSGAVLFTHKGITGPAIFALSAMAAYEKTDRENFGMLHMDLFPDERFESLDNKLLALFDEHGKKRLVNILDMILPHSFCEMFTRICVFEGRDLRGAEVNREQRKIIVKFLKALPFKVTGRFAGEEFVTAGGVDLNEVDHKTMRSKIVPGLFFAGEILDIDGFTGGFNLQAAWATGYLAGQSAAVFS